MSVAVVLVPDDHDFSAGIVVKTKFSAPGISRTPDSVATRSISVSPEPIAAEPTFGARWNSAPVGPEVPPEMVPKPLPSVSQQVGNGSTVPPGPSGPEIRVPVPPAEQ